MARSAVADRHRNEARFVATANLEQRRLATLFTGVLDGLGHRVGRGDRFAVDGEDHIADANALLFGIAAGRDIGDDDAAVIARFEVETEAGKLARFCFRIGRRLRLLGAIEAAERDFDVLGFAVAPDGDGNLRFRSKRSDLVGEVARIADGLAVDRRDDVASEDAGFLRRAVVLRAVDDRTLGLVKTD